MIALLVALSLVAFPDSLVGPRLAKAPVLDGRVVEYGDPAFTFENGARVWLARHGEFVHVAAVMPDTGYYWGDDFVVSLDPDGSGGTNPGDGDRQWYLRRDLDSSLVLIASKGRWMHPGAEPPPLGKMRHAADWGVASSSSAQEWSVELRFRAALLRAMPRIAFRTYDSAWWSFPPARRGERATLVERTPDRWIPLR